LGVIEDIRIGSILSVTAHCIIAPKDPPNNGLPEFIQNQPERKAVR